MISLSPSLSRSETKFDSNSGMFTFMILCWICHFQVTLQRVIYQFKSNLNFKQSGTGQSCQTISGFRMPQTVLLLLMALLLFFPLVQILLFHGKMIARKPCQFCIRPWMIWGWRKWTLGMIFFFLEDKAVLRARSLASQCIREQVICHQIFMTYACIHAHQTRLQSFLWLVNLDVRF